MTKTRLRACLLTLATVGIAHTAAAAAPPVPAHLTAQGSAPGTVTITWDASPGATEYRVYADVDPVATLVSVIPIVLGIAPNGQLVATVSGTSASQSGLPALVRRFYAVVAVNDDGASQPAFAQPDAPGNGRVRRDRDGWRREHFQC